MQKSLARIKRLLNGCEIKHLKSSEILNSPCNLDVGFGAFVLAFLVDIIRDNSVTFNEPIIVIFHHLSFFAEEDKQG